MHINSKLAKALNLTEDLYLPGVKLIYLQNFLSDISADLPTSTVIKLLPFIYKVIEAHSANYKTIQGVVNHNASMITLRFYNILPNNIFCDGIIYTWKDDLPDYIREETQGELFGEPLVTKSIYYKLI